MADNVLINTGTGPSIAAEMVGTDLHQKIKLVIGASGTASPLLFGATAGAASLPVVLATNQATLPVNVVAFTPAGTQDVSVVNTPVITATISNAVLTITASANPLVVSAAQSGAWNCSISGTGNVTIAGTPTVTATLSNAVLVVTASANPIVVAGTVSVSAMPVLSATNVTIASIATGSVSIINTPVFTATISNPSLAVINTAHASRYEAYAVATTATNTILKTSGAHTIFVTDMLLSVDVPMNVTWNSATTAKGTVYLATKGGMVLNLRTPIVCNSAESFTFTPSASGSCSAMVCGYTVT